MNPRRWSQPLRIEHSEIVWLCTCRTINSKLWFVNNKELESRMLGYLAKYQNKHNVVIYAFVIQGNHYHLLAKFPRRNRAAFFRDFNARIAEAVKYCVPRFEGGPLFERRYTAQALPLEVDVEDKFFYCALQPVSAGLTKKISEYPGYNSFGDAISAIKREYKVVRWSEFNAAKRYAPDIRIQDYTELHQLCYSHLPSRVGQTKRRYKEELLESLEVRRQGILKKRKGNGEESVSSKETLESILPGSRPFKTKKGGRRPLVISRCREAANSFLEWYFSTLQVYWNASIRYLVGDLSADFPSGTYKPPGPLIS